MLSEGTARREAPEDVPDFGVTASKELIFMAYLPYRQKNLLPESGGILDQDNDLLSAFATMDNMVTWWRYELRKRDADKLKSIDDLYGDDGTLH